MREHRLKVYRREKWKWSTSLRRDVKDTQDETPAGDLPEDQITRSAHLDETENAWGRCRLGPYLGRRRS